MTLRGMAYVAWWFSWSGGGHRIGRGMRSRFFIAAVPLLLACDLLTISVAEEATTTIAGAGLLGEILGALDFSGFDDFDVTVEQELADQGVAEGDLESVELTVLRLQAEPDLSFIDHMDVYVSADGLADVLVASGDSFPEGQGTVDLDLADVDLAEQVIAGGMAFRVDASGEAPVDDTDVRVVVEVLVTATAQGACAAAGREE